MIVTADHGFVYHEKAPAFLDKAGCETSGAKAVKTHKRFVMGPELECPDPDNAFCGRTRHTAHTEDDWVFIMPKGMQRFNFSGGARFFHGGPLPAEIAIPVVTVSEAKGSRTAETEVRRVGVSLLGTYKKNVTNIPRFKFIQTDPVSERVRPRTLKISLRDGNELISSEETVTFDSAFAAVEDRTRSVKLHLKAVPFDSSRAYELLLRHADDDTEHDRPSVYIDLAFANDF